MKKKLLFFVLMQILFTGWIFAQNPEPDLIRINENRINMNSKGMLVLGGWAISNIVVGGIGMTQTAGNTRYFHQMNAAWNSVNLAIAGFGYYGIKNQDSNLNLSDTLSEFHNFEKILLFNAGLDVGYMAIGAYLWERGLRKENERLIGYGQSMILQGGFLFTFDLILYFLNSAESSSLLNHLDNIHFTGTALSLSIPF
jgi:hypothetical protein